MKNLKINITSESKTAEVVTVTTESFSDRVPSNWIITPTGTGISAVNSKSKETFVGSFSEFNKRLRD